MRAIGPRATRSWMWLLVATVLLASADGQRGRDHDGHQGPNGGPGNGEGPGKAPSCTEDQSTAGIDASSTYAKCTGLEYADFMSLVHVDLEILQDASSCFQEKVDEIEAGRTPGEQLSEEEAQELQDKMDAAFDACVQAAKDADETNAATATTDFLDKILSPDSKICSCFPAFEDKLPECESWSRFRHFGTHLEELCDHVENGDFTLPVAGGVAGLTPASSSSAAGTGTPNDPVAPKGGSHDPHVPNTYGPCAPGQHGQDHGNGPKDCQEPSEEELGDANDGRGGGGPPSDREAGGGALGFGMSVLGVVVVGAFVGVGGVWAWGKFQGGTRQPGVRYMATGLEDNDIGTELGPFGREYA